MVDIGFEGAASICTSVRRRYTGLFASLPNKVSIRSNGQELYFLRSTPFGNSLFSVKTDKKENHSPRMVHTYIDCNSVYNHYNYNRY